MGRPTTSVRAGSSSISVVVPEDDRLMMTIEKQPGGALKVSVDR
jgi:hypothetical protein